jgi:hypothetical protein
MTNRLLNNRTKKKRSNGAGILFSGTDGLPGRNAMSILEKLKKIGHKEPEIRSFCIQTIRFKKFLENARALLDLFNDGREKALGEYIFDRHYVVSLIDSVIERLGMMVYDASVLVPQSGESLYKLYDKHKLAASNLIGFSASGNGGAQSGNDTSEASLSEEPEYQLLSDVLRWFDGKEVPADTTVMDFMKKTFFYVIQYDAAMGFESSDSMKKKNLFETSGVVASDMGIYLVDLWKDALGLPEASRSVRDFSSVPLRHLLMDAGGSDATSGPETISNDISWVAAVSEYQLSLSTLKPGFRFRLETLASGYEQSDFIFIFADQSARLDSILPAGFHIESTDYGQLAWNLDVSAKTIEDSLMIIGRNLFN